MKFKELKLNDALLDALGYMGFEEATPIQQQAIPVIIDGRDIIACAQTGTGKTAAFILPILHKLSLNKSKGTNTLVICPTRELAIQIDRQIQGFSYFLGVDSIAIYGGGSGSDFEQQRKALTQGTHMVIATPGKLISHLNLGYVKFENVEHLILDEADRMLDMGFYEDLQKIISYLPKKRQNLLFSATMAPKLRKLAKKTLHDPFEISIALSKPAEGVLQAVYLAFNEQKNQLIHELIRGKEAYESILIFSSTKSKVSNIVSALRRYNYNVKGVSSDYDQKEREAVLQQFRAKNLQIIVATDVLARGIDIKDINLVINYDVPGNAEDYVHRIGRTARANTTGVALTFVNEEDMPKFRDIERLIDSNIHKLPVPEHLGKSPIWSDNKDFKRKSSKHRFQRKAKPKGRR